MFNTFSEDNSFALEFKIIGSELFKYDSDIFSGLEDFKNKITVCEQNYDCLIQSGNIKNTETFLKPFFIKLQNDKKIAQVNFQCNILFNYYLFRF